MAVPLYRCQMSCKPHYAYEFTGASVKSERLTWLTKICHSRPQGTAEKATTTPKSGRREKKQVALCCDIQDGSGTQMCPNLLNCCTPIHLLILRPKTFFFTKKYTFWVCIRRICKRWGYFLINWLLHCLVMCPINHLDNPHFFHSRMFTKPSPLTCQSCSPPCS